MKLLRKLSLLLASSIVASASVFAFNTQSIDASAAINYVTQSGYVVNWGTRDEECTFLSDYAEDFYTGSYAYSAMSANSGGTAQSDAPRSALYKALKNMMTTEHTHQTSYGETKNLYKYTDCEENDYAHITSFYSAKQLTGQWDGAATWNREHTWPKSKSLGGNDANDIMMLRPTWVQENSSRGNTAYGKSTGYYDPASVGARGAEVRGDCARIVLYVYVRWGNTNNMWGKSGVMESLDVLLEWMEEDPVDTWEMGRNDAVESITGTRNVFVDYPEYAWHLFGRSLPAGMTTPSGGTDANGGSSSGGNGGSSSGNNSSSSGNNSSSSTPDVEVGDGHDWSDWFVISEATDETDGLKMRTCYDCGENQEEVIPRTGCRHEFSDWIVISEATETKDGLQMRTCYECGKSEEEVLPKTGASVEDSVPETDLESSEITSDETDEESKEESSVDESVNEETSEDESKSDETVGEVSGDDNGNNDAMAGCTASVTASFVGITLLSAAGFVLARRRDEE